MSGRRFLFLLSLLFLGGNPASAQVVNRPPEAQWLEPAKSGAAPLLFRRRFERPEGLIHAILHATGSGRLELSLNGTLLKAPGTHGLDLNPAVTNGVNVLQVTLTATNSTPRFALRLELNAGIHGHRWVVSDGSWETSGDGIRWQAAQASRAIGSDGPLFQQGVPRIER